MVRSTYFLAGNLAFVFAQFAVLLFIARLGTPVAVGGYMLALAVLNPMFFFARLDMRRAYAADSEGTHSYYDYRRLNIGLISIIAVVGVLALVLDGETVPGLAFAVLVSRAIDSYLALNYGAHLQSGRQHVIGISLALRGALSILCIFLLYAATSSIAVAIWGLPLGWALTLAFWDAPRTNQRHAAAGKEASFSSDSHAVRDLFFLLIPLGIAGLLGQLNASFPRLLLADVEGTDVLGQVSPALQIHAVVLILAQSAFQPLIPMVSRSLREGKKRSVVVVLLKVGCGAALVGLASCLGAYLLGPWAIHITFGEAYAMAGSFLGIAAISWSLRLLSDVANVLVIGSQKFKHTMILQLLTLLVSIVFIYLGWQYLGIEGVFIGIAITSGFAFLSNIFLCQLILRRR